MPEAHFLQDLLVLFALGIIAVVVFHRANLPPVLGFLLTGVICGPFGFRFVDSMEQVEALAELGVVLLLFTIGIEFSLSRLKQMRKFLLIGGGLQVGVTLGIVALCTWLTGLPLTTAIFIGMLVSLSSTVIAIRLMQHRGELHSAQGSNALIILIFQDLCIVPMVLATPFLSGESSDLTALAWTLGKSVALVVLAVSIASFVLPWLLDHVANTRKREAFVLSIMLLCLGTGWATSKAGMSMALGAFLAGLAVSETKYNHQALSELIPFREVFNFLVFVSIGMLLDVRILLQAPWIIAFSLLALIAIKVFVTSAVAFAFGHSLRVALLTGFALAQVSEFSFVLSKLGLKLGIIDNQLNQIFLAVGILSMCLTPAVYALSGPFSRWLLSALPERWTAGKNNEHDVEGEHLNGHVIVVGYAAAGATLVSVLKKCGIPFVVIDSDPEDVSAAKAAGVPIFYGDAASESVLAHAGIESARLLAITTADMTLAVRAAQTARRLSESVHVVARAKSVEDIARLVKAGAHEVSPEEFVGSVDMFARVLKDFPVDAAVIAERVEEVQAAWADRLPRG